MPESPAVSTSDPSTTTYSISPSLLSVAELFPAAIKPQQPLIPIIQPTSQTQQVFTYFPSPPLPVVADIPALQPPQPEHQSPASPEAESPSPVSNPSSNQLLSKEERKANHVASEKRRRAGIRESYETLCELIPSLHDCLEQETQPVDQQVRSGRLAVGVPTPEPRSSNNGSDRSKKKARANNPISRSEATVLTHTVEYITELNAKRQDLRDRAAKAQAVASHKRLQ